MATILALLESNSILVIPPYYFFETMFNLKAFYEKEYVEAIQHLRKKALIYIEDDVVNEGRSKDRLIKKMAELSQDGFFKMIEHGEVTTFFFEETKIQIGSKISYGIVKGHIHIQDLDSMNAFVDVCSEKYVKSMAGYKEGIDPRIFMTEYKDLLI